jgi:hypothetical protein
VIWFFRRRTPPVCGTSGTIARQRLIIRPDAMLVIAAGILLAVIRYLPVH